MAKRNQPATPAAVLDADEDNGSTTGNGGSDDLWDTTGDVIGDDGKEATEDERPLRQVLSSISRQGVSSRMQEKPLSAQSNEWVSSTFLRLDGLIAEADNGRITAREMDAWVADRDLLEISAKRRGITLARHVPHTDEPLTQIERKPKERTSSTAFPGPEIIEVAITDIDPDPTQARDEGADDELAESIKANGFYESKPIELRAHPQAGQLAGYPHSQAKHPPYMIVDGERRYRGAVKAGLASVPAIVTALADDEGDRLIRQVTSNDSKKLKPMEEARTFKRIMAAKGFNIQQLADHLGKSKSTVSDRLAIVEAPEVFHPLFASAVFPTAAAPIVRRYSEVPPEILKRFVDGLAKDYHLGTFVRSKDAAPLHLIEHALRSIEHSYARRLDQSVAKHYAGPTFTIGKEKYASDVAAYEKAREASYRAPGTSSAAQDRSQQQEAERRRKEAAGQRKRIAIRRAQFAALSAKLPTSIGGSANQADGWSQLLVDLVVKEVHQDTLRVLCGQLQLTSEKTRNGGMSRYADAVRKYSRGLPAPKRVKLALQILMAPDLSQPPYMTGGPERFSAIAKLAKVDLAKVKLPERELSDKEKAVAHALHAKKKARR